MARCDTIIRNGLVVRESGVEAVDIAISDGTLVEIAPQMAGAARETIDARGMHVFPGLIDPHVHFNEPGRTDWEGIETGSSALAAGGGTCFFDMPLNSSPPVLDGESFDRKHAAARGRSVTDFALWGGLTPVNLDQLGALAARGVIGFKAFMCASGIDEFPQADDDTLLRGMQIAASLNLPVAVHAEDEATTSLLAAEAVREGRIGPRDFARSRPVSAEVAAIRRAIEMAKAAGCRLHIVHVSSGEGARAANVGREHADISFETCPHYLLLTEDDFAGIGPLAKCAPPLRPHDDVHALRTALAAGEIDMIGSDHSPSPPSMKGGDDLFAAWGGISGVQVTLGAVLSIEPSMPPKHVARCTSGNVAARFNIQRKGRSAVGFDADLTLVDLQRSYTLTREMLLDRHRLSPYIGRQFRGVVQRTIVRGKTVFLDGRIVAKPAGRLVKPA